MTSISWLRSHGCKMQDRIFISVYIGLYVYWELDIYLVPHFLWHQTSGVFFWGGGSKSRFKDCFLSSCLLYMIFRAYVDVEITLLTKLFSNVYVPWWQGIFNSASSETHRGPPNNRTSAFYNWQSYDIVNCKCYQIFWFFASDAKIRIPNFRRLGALSGNVRRC